MWYVYIQYLEVTKAVSEYIHVNTKCFPWKESTMLLVPHIDT